MRNQQETMVELMGVEPTASRVRWSKPTREEKKDFDFLFSLYEQQQQIDGCSQAGIYAARRLKQSFAGFLVEEITALRINEHILRRRRSGAANSTINREMAALGRMFQLAHRYEFLTTIPFIPKLREASPRQGFIEKPELLELLPYIKSEAVRQAVEFLYLSGWRKNEVLRLEWTQVSEDAARLDPRHSKNRESRLLPLEGRLKEIVSERRPRRHGQFVFHHNGHRITDFRKVWRKATKAAGLEGLLVHDLRRSAVRNLVRAGVPEGVAMKITGHKTRAVFERYNIVSETDLRAALARVT